MKDLTKIYRPTNWNNLIGQSNIITPLLRSYEAGRFPARLLFVGPPGCGKSSAAELLGKLLMCDSPGADLNPCGKCPSCQSSRMVIKYNMAEYNKNKAAFLKTEDKDILQVLKDIFEFKALEGKACYILEEINALSKENLQPFLEALTKQPDNVYVICCTNHKYALSEEFRNRFITLEFNLPTTKECVAYANSLILAETGATIDNSILNEYVSLLGNSPRSIAHYLQILISNNFNMQSIRNILNKVDNSLMDDFLLQLSPDKSPSDLSKWLFLTDRDKLPKVLNNLRSYLINCLMSLSDPKRSGLSKQALTTLNSIGEENLLNIMKAVGDIPRFSNVSVEDAAFYLLNIKLKQNAVPVTAPTPQVNLTESAAKTHMQALSESQHFISTEESKASNIAVDFGPVEINNLALEVYEED